MVPVALSDHDANTNYLNCFKYVIRPTKVHSTKIQVFDSKTYLVDKNYRKTFKPLKEVELFSKV